MRVAVWSSLVVLAAALFVPPGAAQPRSHAQIGVGLFQKNVDGALADYLSGDVRYAVHERLQLSARAGYAVSDRRSASAAQTEAWHGHRYLLLDLGARLPLLHLRAGTHRLGVQGGVSGQRYAEQHARLVHHAFAEDDFRRMLTAQRPQFDDAYVYMRDESGTTTWTTVYADTRRGARLGGYVGGHYTLQVRSWVATFEANVFEYLGGRFMADYGVTLGVAL